MPHHHSPHEVQGKNLLFSIVLNVVITVAQAVGGILSGSLALISDALHNFSDVLTLIFSYIANVLSKRKASLDQTFGYKRAELIAAFVNAITLIIVAVYLIFEASHRFSNPQRIKSNLVIWLSILGILVNGISALMLKKDANHNINMKSAYIHLFTDMMASVVVLVGGILMKRYQIYWIDSILTFAIAIYLIYVGYDLLKESTKMLMLFTPSEIDIKEIVREVHKVSGVNKLHHIHVWHLNDHELHLEAHLDCLEDIKMSEFNLLLHKIEVVLLEKFQINHTNIQPEFQKEDSKNFIVQD
ncbi:cation transporter [Flavobacterium psychrophilum]|uniref:cation diffusion facilitator family transporter n=1 Tax=Flavobacterium psychrophilum TaxID=96345 RepID=UPI000B7C4503|nr:cation diffusion facilitator family transporter [Flavobacterium psychrophilum]EKT4550290.1 cation transporter [Flavobacterium psychrophilum]ELM3644333.1 cation transporter [Flavobacterium psychrophilum]ELY1991123.1 cation transporter [Flavobacterium psychrophilum]SNA70354.1 Cation efflux system protein CzcD [Flavobacterium psychrophilum]SNA73686.1 Cation efflux system protein CzcD [Flavobacterium psychrophilum]